MGIQSVLGRDITLPSLHCFLTLSMFLSWKFWSGRIFGLTLGDLVQASKPSLPLSDDYCEHDIIPRCHPKKYQIVCYLLLRCQLLSMELSREGFDLVDLAYTYVTTNCYPENWKPEAHTKEEGKEVRSQGWGTILQEEVERKGKVQRWKYVNLCIHVLHRLSCNTTSQTSIIVGTT